METKLLIKKSINENKATLSLTGRLDTLTSEELGKAIGDLGDDITSLVLDLSGLEYISSSGIRQLLLAYKRMAKKDGLIIMNVPDLIMEVLKMTGLDSRLTIQ